MLDRLSNISGPSVLLSSLALTLCLAAFVPAVVAASTDLPAELQSKLDLLPDDRTRAELLERELAANPDDALIEFHLGNKYFDMTQFAQAAEHLERSATLRTDFVEAYVNLGSVYDEMGQLSKALTSYKAALAINPTEEKTLCNIGGVYFKKRQIDRALMSFQKALEHTPNSQLAHYNLAILFADAGIYGEAVAEWQMVVDIDSASDLGQRSKENIGIIRQMQEVETPVLDSGDHSGHNH